MGVTVHNVEQERSQSDVCTVLSKNGIRPSQFCYSGTTQGGDKKRKLKRKKIISDISIPYHRLCMDARLVRMRRNTLYTSIDVIYIYGYDYMGKGSQ